MNNSPLLNFQNLNSSENKNLLSKSSLYKGDFLQELNSLEESKKGLIDKNNLLQWKINRLEQKITAYKEEKYLNTWGGAPESVIFSDTLNCKIEIGN